MSERGRLRRGPGRSGAGRAGVAGPVGVSPAIAVSDAVRAELDERVTPLGAQARDAVGEPDRLADVPDPVVRASQLARLSGSPVRLETTGISARL